ncbi:MAG: hypothetical protein GF416_07790 [Candidatus Altiarchaeales archaeon]|nr:hypothetical protein [Candidatus Altiarchaeales archaeon]MBD3417014.1 hypothetical protein [Candidatus Altiarchaeales archaeon]
MDFERFAEGLGLTRQQLDILQCVYRLKSDGEDTSPKTILDEYKRLRGKLMLKANLFKILRFLKVKGFIIRSDHGRYDVNFEGIEHALVEKREYYRRDLDEFEDLMSDVEDFFSKSKLSKFKPVVEYLDHTPFFLKIAQTSKTAKRLYALGRFANITYSQRLLDFIDRGNCFRDIHDLCFVKKKLHVTYLTSFDVDYIYNHALKLYHDPEWAYRECEVIIDNLKNLREIETLDLIYLEDLPGLHLVFPERDKVSEVMLYLRDNKGEIIGGVYIKSPDTARSAKEMYMKEYEKGVNLKGRKGLKIIKEVKSQLRSKYGNKDE